MSLSFLSYLDRIKLLMMMAMTVGHIAWVFVVTDSLLGQVMHFFARMTVALACFLVVEGFLRTHDLYGYAKRLFGFALLAQLPYIMMQVGIWRIVYDVPIILAQLNVLFSLGCGLLALMAWHRFLNAKPSNTKGLMLAVVALMIGLSWFCDWGWAVIVWVLAIYQYRAKGFLWATIAMMVMSWWLPNEHPLAPVYAHQAMEYGLFLAYPVMYWYDKQKQDSPIGYRLPRLMFYWYYVLHLLILGVCVQYSPLALDYGVSCQRQGCEWSESP